MIPTLTSFRQISKDVSASLRSVAYDRMVQRETAYYEAKISDIKSIDDFMGDNRIYAYVLHAFGMDDVAPSKALVRKVLGGGVDDNNSLANSLSDSRFRDLTETFNFARYGTATTSFTRTQSGLVDRYMRATLERNAGQINEGVRLALYFQRKAPQITSIYQVLGDKALYKVVETALSLPTSLPAVGVEKQASIIAEKLDVSSLQDPVTLDKFIARFSNLWDLAQNTTGSSAALQLFQASSTSGISMDTLASIQNLNVRKW
ncbi:MAG: DUF1217 domain-containing protein [Hyphomicrobium sp.]